MHTELHTARYPIRRGNTDIHIPRNAHLHSLTHTYTHMRLLTCAHTRRCAYQRMYTILSYTHMSLIHTYVRTRTYVSSSVRHKAVLNYMFIYVHIYMNLYMYIEYACISVLSHQTSRMILLRRDDRDVDCTGRHSRVERPLYTLLKQDMCITCSVLP